jgi:hypothetical protein
MLELIKKNSLVGLSLAIAAGLVLARVVLVLCGYIYNNFIEYNPDFVYLVIDLAAFGAILAGLFFLLRWLRRGQWEVGKKGWFTFMFISALASKVLTGPTLNWLFPAETYISVAGYGSASDYAARLAANRAMVIYAVFYVFCMLVLFSSAKLIWAMCERSNRRRALLVR